MLYTMKRSIIVIVAMAAATAHAQTVNDGIKMYNYARYASAEKILAPLATANPLANYYFGLSQLEENNVEGAKATFGKFPDDAANIAGQARVAYYQNNMAGALQLATNAANKAKKKEWQPLEYAGDAITYSDNVTDPAALQQAITWYKKALESTDDANVHIGLGDAYLKLAGGGGDAMNNYEHVTEKDLKNSLAFSRIGALWYAARNYPSALDNYEKAKQADPTNPIPYRDLANAYERVGKYDQSLQNMQQYLQLSDKSVDDQVQYVEILYLSKHDSAAAKSADSLINLGVRKPGLYGILGYSQFNIQDTANALKNARVYFNTQDNKKITYSDYVMYGKIFSSNSMADSADYYYGKAAAMDTAKDKSDLYRPIAEGFKAQKNYPKAATWYNRIITENPGAQPSDYFWAGAMYYYAKDYPNGASIFEKMEAKYPDQPSATYWRGRVAAAIDNEAKEGTAAPFFIKWLGIVNNAPDKKGDIKIAEEYLLLYSFNKKDKENEEKYKKAILEIDRDDNMVKQINAVEAAPAKPAKAAPKKK